VDLSWNSGGAPPWNYRGTGSRGAWNCRGTGVEVTLRAAKQPGAKSRAPDTLSLWRVVWKRGTHLSPFPRIVPAFSPRDVHAPRPPTPSARPGLNHRTCDSRRGRPRASFAGPVGRTTGLSNVARTPYWPWMPGRTAQPRPRERRGGRTGRLPGLAEPEGAAPDEHSAGAGRRPGGAAPGADSVQPAVTDSRRRARQQSATTTTGVEYGRTPSSGAYARESGGSSRLGSAGERVGIRSSSATSPGALARRVVPWLEKGQRPGGR